MEAGAVMTIRDRERELILATLNQYGGSRRKVAKALRIGRDLLTKKLAQYAAAGFSVPQEPTSNANRYRRARSPGAES